MESRQQSGSKAEKGEDRRSNKTRQNNKRADRKMKSNDSPRDSRQGGASETPDHDHPSVQKNGDFESIKHRRERTGSCEIRQNQNPDPL